MKLNRLFDNAHSYKTAANAEKNLQKAIDALAPETQESMVGVHYNILVNSEGRFSAQVFLQRENSDLMHYFIANKVCAFVVG